MKIFAEISGSLQLKKDLELIRFYRLSDKVCCRGNVFKMLESLTSWMFHRRNSCRDFYQIFRKSLTQKDLEVNGFRGVSSKGWLPWHHFLRFFGQKRY